jgi:hypothetical protein
MRKPLNTVYVVLGLPRSVPAVIIRVNAILAAMTANKATFPSPPIAFATVTTHADALSAAESATKTKAIGTIQTRDDALKLVIADANQLHGYVQQLANASPAQAANIVVDAAMTLRKTGAHPKADLTVKQTVSGTVHVVARSVIGAKSHEWQYSLDGGKTWTSASPTTKASTTLSGFQSGTLVQVRQRAILKTGPTDWSSVTQAAVS